MGLARKAGKNAARQGNAINEILANRGAVVNPYENVSDLSGLISNPYANMTNSYANLTNTYGNLTNAYEGITNPYSNLSSAYDSLSNPYANLTNSFAGMQNAYADITNAYADVGNAYADMTNPYENLQVATRAAEMANEQTDISLASTLDTLRATGSGAGGATALAREAASSKLQIAAGIEQQEAQNTKLRAQGEQQRQMAVAQGEQSRQMATAQGSMAQQMARAQGSMQQQQLMMGADQANQMAMAQGSMQTQMARAQGQQQLMMAGAQADLMNQQNIAQQAMANQMAYAGAAQANQMAYAQGDQMMQYYQGQGASQEMQMRMAEAERLQNADILGQTFVFNAEESRRNADLSRASSLQQQYLQQQTDIKSANKQLWAAGISAVGDMASAAMKAGLISERALKKNIKLVGKSKSGLNIYEFEYKDKKHGDGVYQGVMVDEAPSYAVVDMGENLGVDYSKIDVEFKRVR